MLVDNKKYLTLFIIMVLNISNGSFSSEDYSIENLTNNDMEIISNKTILPRIYKHNNVPKIKYNDEQSLDFFSNHKNLSVNPIIGIRFSSSGFELNPLLIPEETLWLTPGIKFRYRNTLISPYSGILLNIWGSFYKHSAYFLKKTIFNKESLKNANLKPFHYNPYISMEYFVNTEKPEWGIDFDEAQGGISISSRNLDIYFGKFKSSFGPFLRGNLSISHNTPSFPQFRFDYIHSFNNKKKIDFTYLIGDLISEIEDSSVMNAYQNSEIIKQLRLPWIKRGIIYHRVDFHINQRLRVGFYELVVFGARQTPWQYLIPINFYWSAQHATGDFDNLQMGFDLDYIHNNGRTNFAILVDEWAPYETFTSNHHNWFGFQLGRTQFFSIYNQKFYFRIENTVIMPQIYEHKFPINSVFNHGYPIGFWTGGDAFDTWITIKSIGKKFRPRFELEYTIFGSPKYQIGRKYLSVNDKFRLKYSLVFDYKFKSFSKIELCISHFYTEEINNNIQNYFSLDLSFKYNISY